MEGLSCNEKLFHYNGYCFNKSRVPEGHVALPEHECQEMDQEVVTIIN